MRIPEFTTWLENWIKPRGGHLSKGNFNFYLKRTRKVEEAQGINLDKEFRKDKMTGLYDSYKYSMQDERDKRPNPTNLKINTRLYAALSDTRTALNHYRRFCEKHPPK